MQANTIAESEMSPDQLLQFTLETLDEFKALDPVSIDLRGKTPLSDFMVIATGTSSRHVGTLVDKLAETFKQKAGVVPRTEGADQGDWALMDAGDVIVHIFRAEVREFYNLERMWNSEIPGSVAGAEITAGAAN